MARPMPVLPDVPSMIVPPGLSRPALSASSIIRTAIRSLIEFPGLNVSIFASTVASMTPRVMRLMRTIGVLPMTSRMFPATLRRVMAKMLRDLFDRQPPAKELQQEGRRSRGQELLLKGIGATKLLSMGLIEPLVAVLLGAVFLEERLTASTAL